jgi:hypothetical protein
MKPKLFDIVELLVNLPESQQSIGTQGTIVECQVFAPLKKLLLIINIMR